MSFGMFRASAHPCLECTHTCSSTMGSMTVPAGRSGVKATVDWLAAAGAQFSPRRGRSGCAHLAHYTAQYCEWGEGPPLVLIPGLAGGFELLGPLARNLARSYRVISYQLRGEDDCFALRSCFGLKDLIHDLAEFM